MAIITMIKNFFVFRPKLEAYFVDPTGRMHMKKVKYKNDTFEVKLPGQEKELYTVDLRKIVYNFKTGLPMQKYTMHNPEPQSWGYEAHKDIDAAGFRNIIDRHVVIDLFAKDAAEKIFWILVLCIIIALVTIYTALVVSKVIHVGVGVAP